MRTIQWKDNKVLLIDQTKLPESLEYIECNDLPRLVQAIQTLEIRGAPAIGIATAMALALVAVSSRVESTHMFLKELELNARAVKQTRPTAWNLFWAADRILNAARSFNGSIQELKEMVVTQAKAIAEEDITINKIMGTNGAALLDSGDVIGTICNAGWLATAGEYGTALGVVKVAHEQGKLIRVLALETRPVLQGARLTTWELQQDRIPVSVIVDGAVGYCLSKEMIDKFIVGADRIVVKDGCYVLNKIGTYSAAIVARQHNVPFYIAAPFSTFDFDHSLDEVVVEERSPKEVTELGSRRLVAEGVDVFNPAFDVTPPALVSAIITERGVLYPPFKENLHRLVPPRA